MLSLGGWSLDRAARYSKHKNRLLSDDAARQARIRAHGMTTHARLIPLCRLGPKNKMLKRKEKGPLFRTLSAVL